MTMPIEDFGTAVSLKVGDDEIWSPSGAADPVDWKSLYERARAWEERTKARCEELRWSEVRARNRAGAMKAAFDRNWVKLKAAREEMKEARSRSARTLA